MFTLKLFLGSKSTFCLAEGGQDGAQAEHCFVLPELLQCARSKNRHCQWRDYPGITTCQHSLSQDKRIVSCTRHCNTMCPPPAPHTATNIYFQFHQTYCGCRNKLDSLLSFWIVWMLCLGVSSKPQQCWLVPLQECEYLVLQIFLPCWREVWRRP